MEIPIIYLTAADFVALNAELIEKYNDGNLIGEDNIKNETEFPALIEGPQNDLYYPDLYSKAAFIARKINTSHIFHDGNKRTGVFAAIRFLSMNGIEPIPEEEFKEKELEEFGFSLAGEPERPSDEDIVQWFKERFRPI